MFATGWFFRFYRSWLKAVVCEKLMINNNSPRRRRVTRFICAKIAISNHIRNKKSKNFFTTLASNAHILTKIPFIGVPRKIVLSRLASRFSFYHGKDGNRRGWVTEFFFGGGGSRYAAALNVTEAGAAAPGPPGTEGVWSESR